MEPSDHQRGEERKSQRAGSMVRSPSRTDLSRSVVMDAAHAPSGHVDGQVDLSVTEIAVMWMLHHRALPSVPQRSLTQDILEFCPVALSAITRAVSLRGAKRSDLRLIYFKGLIVAQTHPTQQMIEAIRRAERVLEQTSAGDPSLDAPVPIPKSLPPSEDQNTLAHIADALGPSSNASH